MDSRKGANDRDAPGVRFNKRPANVLIGRQRR
jgi:hypothetical protein